MNQVLESLLDDKVIDQKELIEKLMTEVRQATNLVHVISYGLVLMREI